MRIIKVTIVARKEYARKDAEKTLCFCPPGTCSGGRADFGYSRRIVHDLAFVEHVLRPAVSLHVYRRKHIFFRFNIAESVDHIDRTADSQQYRIF